ncbi:MAG: hypothetical protein ACREHD_32845, partial [Pirellulales bacterium]
ATITWTGKSATSSNWSDPANWDLGRAPINGDSLVFPASAQQLSNDDDIAGLSVNSITFQGTFAPVPGGYRISGDDMTIGSGGINDQATGGPTATVGLTNEIDLNLNLSAAQTWSNSGSPSFPLAIDGNVDNAGFSLTATGNGVIDVGGQISGSGGLALNGNGPAAGPTVELQNADSYTGETSVGEGTTLIVNGSTVAASGVYVDGGTLGGTGGTLGGTGTVGGEIKFLAFGLLPNSIPGTLDPGHDANLSEETGTLSNTGGVDYLPPTVVIGDVSFGVQFAMQLGGTAANPTNDQLDSAGTVSLSGTLDLTALAGAGPFNAGQQFVIVQAGAPITSTFDGLPE